ncbi:MAG: NTP transferase domain-containing protein [Candidatus Hydrogenedentes bacterium]|nr:NTP transferase domain-containing protein [Candidatus Hydrogenedentota bacterium]
MAYVGHTIRVGVIMAGGSGERFWPLSRQDKPKQLLRLTSEHESMLEEAVNRLLPVVPREQIYVVTSQRLVAPIRESGVNIPKENVLGEPCKRNTSGALAFATAAILADQGKTPEQVSMAVITADHQIGDPDLFCKTVSAALDAAEKDTVLGTLGIVPTRPETGYGYIQIDEALSSTPPGTPATYSVRAFHEKPSQERAEDFIAAKCYFWNSGMFFWRASTFLAELDTARPALASAIRKITDALLGGRHQEAIAIFETLEDISIDYALMEHARRAVMVRADFPWDDVGSWPALERSYPQDARGNVTVGNPVLVDSEGCIVYNDAGSEAVAVSVVGAKDLVVVVTKDGVLVVPKDRAQDVRKAVTEIKRRGGTQI